MALVCWLLAGDVALDFDFLHRDLALLVLDRYGTSRRLDAKGVLCNTVLNFLVIWNYILLGMVFPFVVLLTKSAINE